jgi:S1-C subfamily serine protease
MVVAVVFVTAAGGLSYLTLEWVALSEINVVAQYPVVAQILSGGRGVSRGVFTPRGYVIAMVHGVPDPDNLVVGWEEGGERRQSAAEVVRRGSGEVLLLRLSGRPLQQYSHSLPIRIAATLEPEEHVERYLSPTDRAPGQVKQLFATRDITTGDGQVRLSRLLVTTMIAGPGDSGAPVVDAAGRVVGLIYGASQTETVSLMIEDIKAYFSEAF